MPHFLKGFISDYIQNLGNNASDRESGAELSSAWSTVVGKADEEELVSFAKSIPDIGPKTKVSLNKVIEMPIYGYVEEEDLEDLVA